MEDNKIVEVKALKKSLRDIFAILLVFVLIASFGFYSYGNIGELPEEPGEPTDPVEPEEPVDPETPTEPEEPEEPENPVDPEEPTEPVDPETPQDPEEPGEPMEPEEPLPEEPVEPPKAILTINHILNEGDEEQIIDTEVLEDLEVGTTVNSSDYIKDYEEYSFLYYSIEELTLIEGENIINIYYEYEYELLDDGYIPEAPDFPIGEGETIEAPYIEEFPPGSLGPFEDEIGNFRLNHRRTLLYDDEINNKDWPQPGSLNIGKSGEPVPGSGNQWEITLEIAGKNLKKTTDIVLVIDRSGSMRDDNKMANAKIAAKAFVNRLLVDEVNDNIRIAVVSFSGDVTINSNFRGYSGKGALISAIDGISAVGGTHTQAGIRQGIVLLNGSEADYKSMVLLSDGAATYSYGINNPNDYLEYWKTSGLITHYRTTSIVPETQFNYSSTVGDGTSEHTQYESAWRVRRHYRHGASAVAESGFGKSAGYEIYSIALSAGEEGEWTLENVASPGNYYPTSDPEDLEPIFEEIAGRISYAATNAVVTDPLGEMYSILGINPSNYNNLITVSHGTISYDTASDTIRWDIGTISEGNRYWMKYTVALDYSAEGGVYYLANKPTYIDYTNIDGLAAKKYFPIPEFRLRALKFTKLLENSNGENKEFDIVLEGPTGQYKKVWTVSLKQGESKAIKGLLPGTYTIKEIVPMNYKLINMSGGSITYVTKNTYELVICEDDWNISINVENKKDNDGWFWHDPDPKVNSFKVGGESRKSIFGKFMDFVLPQALKSTFGIGNA